MYSNNLLRIVGIDLKFLPNIYLELEKITKERKKKNENNQNTQ
jgi:hypothetical protein